MDMKKMFLGLATLAMVVGIALVCFTPGGFLNRQNQSVAMAMPGFGEMRIDAGSPGLGSPGPVTGFILMFLGAAGYVVAFSMKPSTGKPEPLA